MNTNSPFLHERLHTYHHARAFYRVIVRIYAQLPRSHAPICDQLDRAASSVSLAIAERAGAWAPRIERVHFDWARASGDECAAALDQIEDDREACRAACVALNVAHVHPT